MLQAKPTMLHGLGNCAPEHAADKTADDSSSFKESAISKTLSPSVMYIKPDPDAVKPQQVLKQAITPMNGKPNLLKLLNKRSSTKSEVFKTIGNRIVIPMKVTVSSKKLAEIESNVALEKKNLSPTFQMQLSNNQPQKITSVGANGKPVLKTISGLSNVHKQHSFGKVLQSSINLLSNGNISTNYKVDLSTAARKENTALCKFQACIPPTSHISPRSCLNDRESIMTSFESIKSSISELGEQFDEDNELTCLSWLHNNKELLETIRKCNPDDPGIGMSGDEMENEENPSNNKSIFLASSPIYGQSTASSQATKNVPYNPKSKPPYSFSCLIFMAIEASYLKRLPVKDIYSWVRKHFPYFETAPSGWKNSIRHNLSLNRCFKKAECRKDLGKSSLWCIDPAYRPNLVQALKRSPFYPYLHPTDIGQPLSLNNLANLLPQSHTGRVPSWSPALPADTLWADPDMASAALNLMGLRGNDGGVPNNSDGISKSVEEIYRDVNWISSFENSFRDDSVGSELVITCGSQQDHLYTCPPPKKKVKKEDNRCRSPDSEKSAPDAAYEFESAELSDDEIEENVLEEIVEEVVVGEQESEEDEDRSLFDSGFGSMKNFDVNRNKRNKSKKLKTSKTKAITPVKRKSLNNNSSGLATRLSKRLKLTSKQTRGKSARRKSDKSQRVKVCINKQSISSVKHKKTYKDKKNSDVDSGKDSPKVDRLSRSKRYIRRSHRISATSDYHTRSSSHKLLGQNKDDESLTIRKRKRLLSNRAETTDEEEEIKRAAGSLLRLAGLLKSPISSKKSPTN